jgi:hypothetical protein
MQRLQCSIGNGGELLFASPMQTRLCFDGQHIEMHLQNGRTVAGIACSRAANVILASCRACRCICHCHRDRKPAKVSAARRHVRFALRTPIAYLHAAGPSRAFDNTPRPRHGSKVRRCSPVLTCKHLQRRRKQRLQPPLRVVVVALVAVVAVFVAMVEAC